MRPLRDIIDEDEVLGTKQEFSGVEEEQLRPRREGEIIRKIREKRVGTNYHKRYKAR